MTENHTDDVNIFNFFLSPFLFCLKSSSKDERSIFHMLLTQESLCADAASFDLSSGLLTACITEAKDCENISIARREKSNDKSCDPDKFAVLRGKLNIFLI